MQLVLLAIPTMKLMSVEFDMLFLGWVAVSRGAETASGS